MKRLFTLLFLSIPILGFSQITTFPYFEDFESGPGGWVSGSSNFVDSWVLGTPNYGVINQAAPGGSMSWYTDTTGFETSEYSHVISPEFDFSGLSYPTISLDIWWDLVTDVDGAVLQSSTNAGSTWENVGHQDDGPGLATNWYNHAFLSEGFPNGGAGLQQVSHWSGDSLDGSQGWVTASHFLEGLAGEPSVFFRFAWANRNGNANRPADNVAFDNVQIVEGPGVDLSVTAVDQAGPCGGGFEGQAYITISNLGGGNATVTEIEDDQGNTYPLESPVDFAPFSTEVILVSLPLQNPGTPTMVLGVDHMADSTTSNNFMAATFNCQVISGLNHCNDFEDDSTATWFEEPEGMNSSWGLGSNASNNTINTPFSGSYFWGTTGPGGGYNPNEQSSIVSPFFDFSNLQNSAISIQLWTDLETDYDGGVLQYSLDGGSTWFNVGTQGTGTNWYNAGALSGGGAGGQNAANWNGATGGWVSATNVTPMLDGAANVLFRVSIGADDIFQDAGIGLDDFCTTAEEGPQVYEPKVVINEFSYEDPAGHIMEFIELKNNDTIPFNMADFTVQLIEGTGGGASIYNEIGSSEMMGILQPNDYFVIGAAGGVPNADITPFMVVSENLKDTGAIALVYNPLGIIDKVSYSTSVPGYTETSHVDGIFINYFVMSVARIPDGTDTDNNSEDFNSYTIQTPGRANELELSDTLDLVINEVSESDQLYVEIYNKEQNEVDLTNFVLEISDGESPGLYTFFGSIQPQGYRILEISGGSMFDQSMRLFQNNVRVDGLCIGDSQTLEINGATCEEGNVEYYSADFEILPGTVCSVSRIPNGEDSDNNENDFSLVSPSPGAINLDQACAYTGINNLEEAPLELFPNPTPRFLQVSGMSQGNASKDVSIVDLFGRVVFRNQLGASEMLDLNELNSGIYFLRIGEGRTATRFIKQ